MHHTHTKPPLFSIHNIDTTLYCAQLHNAVLCVAITLYSLPVLQTKAVMSTHLFSPAPGDQAAFPVQHSDVAQPAVLPAAHSLSASLILVCNTQHKHFPYYTHSYTHTQIHTLSCALSHRCTTNGLPCNRVSVSVHRSTALFVPQIFSLHTVHSLSHLS